MVYDLLSQHIMVLTCDLISTVFISKDNVALYVGCVERGLAAFTRAHTNMVHAGATPGGQGDCPVLDSYSSSMIAKNGLVWGSFV